jgi:type 2 lantibiotic biosynthesis protein LanM
MLPPAISARARYLHERLGDLTPSTVPAGEPSHDLSCANQLGLPNPSTAEGDFLFWKQQFSAGGYDRFPERLKSLAIDEQQAAFLAQDSIPFARSAPGAWETVFEQASQAPALPLAGADVLPFVDLWSPLVSLARESIQANASAAGCVTPAGLDGLLLNLLNDLCEFAALPTFLIFDESRAQGEELTKFVERVRESGYLVLFERFPMLGRQLSRLVSTWMDGTKLFLQRLGQDISEVRQLAQSETSLLAQTQTGISDRHDHGRQVILMTFADGARVLYKPKNISLAKVLSSIEEWLMEHGTKPGWRFARVIVKDGYGWEEYVEQAPCNSQQEVRSYYRSGGQLLGLAYLLNAYDLWRDNLIAAGSSPVLIDTECFFHPGRGRSEPASQDRHITSIGKASVIETGLLPFWQLSASHLPADHSGLGTGVIELPALKVTEWENVKSNDIRPVTKPAPGKPSPNTVRWQGQVQDVRHYQEDVVAGFSALYQTILDRKDAFIQFIERFGEAETRFLYRPTQVYALLQKGARSPHNLTSGVRQSAVFEQLYRVPLRENGLTAQTKQLIDFEVESLLGLDIPRFNVRLDSRDLRSVDFSSPDVLLRRPLDNVLERIAGMGPDDLRFQIEVIRESLQRFPAEIRRPLNQTGAAAIANQLGDEIRARVNLASGEYLWELPSYLPADFGLAERQGIYLGDLGSLIFLGAIDKALGIDRFPETSAFRRRLNQFIPPTGYPLGICHGVGAIIYGSLLLGSLTEEDEWTELALAVNAKHHTFEGVNSLDLTSGVAGFLLAATRLYQVTKNEQARANAEAAARILADRFDPTAGWQQPDGNAYLGFAHGLAGIVFALDQYRRATDEQRYQPLIKQALALEITQFRDLSWPVMMQGTRRTFKNWCNGTAGILMARAATGQLTPETFSSELLGSLLDKVSQRGQSDHWCCGNFGIAEALSYVGQQANLPEAKKKSTVLLEESLERGLKAGFFRLQSSIGENFCFSPSLFRGTAGIGYSLLRLAYPGELPCVLAFEV